MNFIGNLCLSANPLISFIFISAVTLVLCGATVILGAMVHYIIERMSYASKRKGVRK